MKSDSGTTIEITQEEELVSSLKALRELRDYGEVILDEVAKRGVHQGIREVYLSGLYMSAMAHTKGALRLLEDRQHRASMSQVRALYEIRVNTRFIYCSRSFVYVRLLVISGERKRARMADRLAQDGQISQDALRMYTMRLRRNERRLKNAYPDWPEFIPPVTSANKNPIDRGDFLLKDRCVVIDYYDKKYHRGAKRGLSMVDHYNRYYPYISGAPHADALDLDSSFNDSEEVVQLDPYGAGKIGEMIGLSKNAFIFQFDILQHVKKYILKQKDPKMPGWLDLYAKDLGLLE